MDTYDDDTDINDWTTKYRPKKIADIVGNGYVIDTITKWLKMYSKNRKENQKKNNGKVSGKKYIKKVKVEDFDDELTDESVNTEQNIDTDLTEQINENSIEATSKSTYKKKIELNNSSCILINGNHGIGKTCTVRAILEEFKCNVNFINFNKIKNARQIKDIIDRLSHKTNIMSLVNKNYDDKTVIIIDELESLTSRAEMNCIATIIANNEKLWSYPIILIANNKHNKFISDIKNKIFEIKMYLPDEKHMRQLFNKICTSEHITIKNKYTIDKIIEHAQNDFRRLVCILQDLATIYSKDITLDMVNEYCIYSNRKDFDYDLYRASPSILFKYIGFDEILRLYDIDKVNLPLMVQQHYVKTIHLFSTDDQLSTAETISSSLVQGDIVENYIYGNQNWTIHEVHGFHSCIYPSYILNQKTYEYRNFKLDYPDDLNRTSIKFINRKNILKINEYFKNMNINDYIFINHIIRVLIERNKIDDFIDLLKSYNLKFENIDKILKIVRIKKTKFSLTGKQKKEITKKLL